MYVDINCQQIGKISRKYT